jgi:hypothetical protein
MPRNLVFILCERTTRDVFSGEFSLQTVVNGWKFNYSEPEDVRRVSLVPLRWSVFTVWERLDSEEPGEYEQSLKITTAGGAATVPVQLAFQTSERIASVSSNGDTMPVLGDGIYKISLSLRQIFRDGDRVLYSDWEHIGDYPFEVVLTSTVQPQ